MMGDARGRNPAGGLWSTKGPFRRPGSGTAPRFGAAPRPHRGCAAGVRQVLDPGRRFAPGGTGCGTPGAVLRHVSCAAEWSTRTSVLGVGGDLDLDHPVGRRRDGARVRRALLDLVDELHARRDPAPYGVFAVEGRIVLQDDEELAARGVGLVGEAGHRDRAAPVRLPGELGRQQFAHAAPAGAVGIAGLGHEALDHAMEDHAIVLALAGELLDLGHVLGCEVGTHLDDDAAVLEIDVEGVFLVRGERGAGEREGGEREERGGGDGKQQCPAHGHSFASAATWTLIILSGGAATAPDWPAPRLILSTCSMPDVTLPHTVYWPSRKFESLKTMKNWLRALLGSLVRAIETTPRTCGSFENSAFSSSPMPPLPVPFGSPVWAMKPSMTRWKTMPSYLPSRASFLIWATCLGARSGRISMTTRPSLRSM